MAQSRSREGKRIFCRGHVLDSSSAAEKYEKSEVGTTKRIDGKVKSVVFGKPEKNVIALPEAVRVSNNIRTILLGLFTLIGFIVLVASDPYLNKRIISSVAG